jgi:hypothetical protein
MRRNEGVDRSVVLGIIIATCAAEYVRPSALPSEAEKPDARTGMSAEGPGTDPTMQEQKGQPNHISAHRHSNTFELEPRFVAGRRRYSGNRQNRT